MKQKSHKDIWVLSDFRTGNSVQAIAIAEKLGIEFEIKHLEYNLFAKLPNFLLAGTSICVNHATKKNLQTNFPPKLLIAAGRRAGGVGLYLKKLYKDIKLVQIMKPDANNDLFDLIILPQHDVVKGSNSNIMRTIGSINNITDRLKKYDNADFISQYPSMKNFIGVLIGGNTKEYEFQKEDAHELSSILEKVLEYKNIPAFITFSRRTPEIIKNIFRSKFLSPNIIYDPDFSDSDNPFLGILKNANFLIITCDSVSMCSEAASTGRPLYIYTPQSFESRKHRYFVQQLIDLGIARAITLKDTFVEEYSYNPLNEVEKVVDEVRALLS